MTPAPPRLAVVIPTYNHAHVLARALGSVLRSSMADMEVVVVDDGSTDGTMDLLEGYDDPRLIICRLPRHTNGNAARNQGVRATTAPLITFLDADDEFLDGRIERLVAYFAANSDVGTVVDSFSTALGRKYRPAGVPNRSVDQESLIRFLVLHSIPLTTSSICLRRQLFEEIDGFDETLRRQQDRDLLLRLAPVSRVVLGTGDDVVKHQMPKSVSRSMAGYVEGLDKLIARHRVFSEPEYSDVLAYLAVRSFIKCALAGHVGLAVAEARDLSRASNISVSFLSAIARYSRGKNLRRVATMSMYS